MIARYGDRVSRDAHELKTIPLFFQHIWKEQRGENPLDNEERCCEAMEFSKNHPVIDSVVDFFVPPNRNWHFVEYYTQLLELFNLFEVTPNAEVGKLSREEFAGLIAGSLRAKMHQVNKLEGFARLTEYDQFKRMHKAALKWGLCAEDHEQYDPSKKT